MLSQTEPQKAVALSQNARLGNLQQWEKCASGILGTTDHHRVKITIYTDHIFKIHITSNADFDETSYAVVATPTQVNWEIKDTEESLWIKTKALHLQVVKTPLTFRFFTPEGRVINEDDEAFGTSWVGEQVTTYKKLQKGERFIGLGEKTGPLDRRGHGYENWNTDHFGYPPDSDPLYCSTPFYIGAHHGLSYGIYLDNTHKSHFNFGASNRRFSSFSADQGDMSYFFIHHPEVKDIISSYTDLTGRMQLPPLWSLGYQQCRYSYHPDKEVLSVAQTFRDKDIPADVIVLDIHYMEKYKIFTWDKKDFSDPKGMIDKLTKLGFKVVVICDPGIKIEEGYSAYDSGIQEDVFIKYPDGSYYEGEVWPGWCHFPDFTKPEVREWWRKQMKSYASLGIEGYWNDMNEIATWGQQLPELIEFDMDGQKATTRKARNIYGMQMARSTYEGAKANLPNKRVFNLTRAGFSGVQRYSAIWTGDNVADDEHMLLGVRLVNSLGITGVPFAGYDIGGFAGDADGNLFARWIAIGAFAPFFRGHSMINSKDSEPWAYGEEVEEISRNYIRLRYKLMPYIYAAFKESADRGYPVARSLAIEYTHEEKVYDEAYENEYLFGPSILVAPVKSKAEYAKVWLPEGKWYDFFTDKVHKGAKEMVVECPIERLPVYVKASAIIPMQEAPESLNQSKVTKLDLHVYNGVEDNAYHYYEDDGESFDYEQAAFYAREITFSPKQQSLTLGEKEGNFTSRYKSLKLYFHGFDAASLQHLKLNGKDVKVASEEVQFIEPISNFDPFEDPKKVKLAIKEVPYIEFQHDDKTIQITW